MPTNTVIISPKYQVVIPREIRKIIKIKPNEEVSVSIDKTGEAILVKPKRGSWVKYMRDLDKKTWQNIDIDKYIKEEREAWERKI